MGRWIIVHGRAGGERALINLDNVEMVHGRTIFFVGGNDEDYLSVSEEFDEIAKRIMREEQDA